MFTIEEGSATDNSSVGQHKKKSGTFSSKKTTTRDTFNDTTSIGSNLSADSITLVAGATITNDGSVSTQQGVPAVGMSAKCPPQCGDLGAIGQLNINGSSVVATNDVNLNAGADINITASQDTHDETHYKKVKQSGLSSSGASMNQWGQSRLIISK